MNWWLLGVASFLLLTTGTFTVLLVWAHWDILFGNEERKAAKARRQS
ncbi:hypothetical protein [Chelonobacter oris]|nr:hypothetical protein [Chelonobacter oris]